jgi:hypothetical protein
MEKIGQSIRGTSFSRLAHSFCWLLSAPFAVGGKTMRGYRLYLELSVGAFALIWLATPTLFWPLINAIYQVAHHKVAIGDVEALAMVRRWFFYDSIRIIVIAAGFFSAVRSISIPYAESIATSSSSN